MVYSHSNFVERRDAGAIKVIESNYQISRTVPDKTLTLRQLIERHNSGGMVKSFTPQYLGDASLIPVGFERMSLVERAELAKSLPAFIADSRGRLQTMKDAMLKASKEAEAAAKREEYLSLKKEFEGIPGIQDPQG